MSSRPSIEVYVPRELTTRQHTWGREILVCEMRNFIGKILLMKAGQAGGLQAHVNKVEAFFLDEGQAWVDYDKGDGQLTRLVMSTGMTIQVPAGAVHRVTAITDCKFIEWSTPHFSDRVRLEAEYGEPEAGGLPTSLPDATGHP
jgi:mannose-6-phosphate isomerase-like protein (cupin superfamily)